MFWLEKCQIEFKLFLTHNLARVFRPKKLSQLPEAQLYLKILSGFIYKALSIIYIFDMYKVIKSKLYI